MYTEKLFDNDAYLTDCSAIVTSCEETVYNKTNCFAVILNKTVFFPEEGGQQSDKGYIEFNENKYTVFHVSIKNTEEGSIITHFCNEAIPVDSEVKLHIDFEDRFDKMQQHSGEHIVSGLMYSRYGYDNVGFHLSDDYTTLDFNGTFTDEQLKEIEKEANHAIYLNIASRVMFPSSEELLTIQYRSKKELKGQIRIVEFPGYDICACCAPHVKTTGEIGMIKFINAEHLKGGTRITIKCGYRAIQYFESCLDDRRYISRLLSVKTEETPSGVQKLFDQNQQLRYSFIELQKKYFKLIIDELNVNDTHLLFTETGDADIVREATNYAISLGHRYFAAFIGNDDNGYRYILATKEPNANEYLHLLSSKLTLKAVVREL